MWIREVSWVYVQARLSIPERIILSMAVGSGEPDPGNLQPRHPRCAGGRAGGRSLPWWQLFPVRVDDHLRHPQGRAYSNS